MMIVVGSKNQVKVLAVREVLADYPIFSGFEVAGVSVETGVKDQPLSIEETVRGAKTRAENAYRQGSLAIGLESGLMPLPGSEDIMDVCFCSFYNGERHHVGMSCGFVIPREVAKHIYEEGMDLTQAMSAAGYSDNPSLGEAEGAIGIFTGGRITRKEYTRQAVITALVPLTNWNHGEPEPKKDLCAAAYSGN